MKFNEIKELIDKIDSSNIAYFEVKIDDVYVKMDKSLTRNFSEVKKQELVEENKVYSTNEVEKTSSAKTVSQSAEKITEAAADSCAKISDNDFIVKSPMVGTFYSAPGAGQNDFVSVGKNVKAGDTLCIVEAMKLMNEIECEVSGEIVEVIAKNGSMVEYGAELFRIRRS